MRISDWSSDVCSSDLPGASLLPVDEKGAVGDCFGPKEAIFAAFLEQMGEGTQQPVAVNAAVDDEMRDMDALRADLASETLRQGAHDGLGSRKSTEPRLSAARPRCAAQEQCSGPARTQPPVGVPPGPTRAAR